MCQPSSLLDGRSVGAPAFQDVWDRLPIGRDWRSCVDLDLDGGLFLKGHQIPSLAKPQMWMRRFHIQREFAVLSRLRRLGLPIPDPLALGVESHWGIPRRAFLLERLIRGSVDLERLLRGRDRSREERVAALGAAGALVGRLHRDGLYHGDLACRNLLVRATPAGPEAYVVDVPRLVATRRPSARRRRKDLLRLAKTALRCGADDTELAALLAPAAGEDATRLVAVARRTRILRLRPLRKLRIALWRTTGR